MARRWIAFDHTLWGALLCLSSAIALGATAARADERSWIGEISGIGPDAAVTVVLGNGVETREVFTATVTNTGTVPWGDFHFGIFDPMGGQNIANVDFLDASMGGEDPTSSQSGLTWIINDVVVGATIDLYFCSDPVMPGETAVFTVYFVNPDQITFPGMLFYPTPVPTQGACCEPGGACTLTCEHDCVAPSEFHSEWTSCVPNPCPQPLGACCDPETGACTYVERSACPIGWAWMSDVPCVPTNPCTPPVPARNTTWGEIKARYK